MLILNRVVPTSYLPASIYFGSRLFSSVRITHPAIAKLLSNLNWLVYPETRNRSLESIEALFSTHSPFYWKMEQAYKLHGDVLAEHGVSKGSSDAVQSELTFAEKPEPDHSHA